MPCRACAPPSASTKAEGGWGVVCTGYVSIDPSSDDAPLPFATLWDEDDVRSHALMTEAVHRRARWPGIELWHGGGSVMNRTSRMRADVAFGNGVDGDARELHGQSAAARHGDAGHPPAARLAGGSRTQGAPRRLRHRLRLCRHGLPALRVPAAGVEPAHRRVRRQRRQPGAHRARAARGHARGGAAASARSRCASASRSCAPDRARSPRPRPTRWSACWPSCPTCGT